MAEKKVQQKNDNRKEKKEEVLPRESMDTSSPSPGSMSEGNLSNNRYGRTRNRTPHTKKFVTGSDDDGQAN